MRSGAVVHSARGLSGTENSAVLKPLTSVPSSGRPSWLTTVMTSGKEARISRDCLVRRAASLGEMDSGIVTRTQREPSSSLGRNSLPS